MDKEEKDLLLKDLCARLPYGVIVRGIFINYNKDKDKILYEECDKRLDYQDLNRYESLKPYLRPMSSMTDKELVEFLEIRGRNLDSEELKTFREGQTVIVSILPFYSRHIDWLNAHHFDYRGLIEKGLALEAPEGMYKEKQQ